MSHAWMIQGQVREKPKNERIRGEYQGEDVYSPNAPNRADGGNWQMSNIGWGGHVIWLELRRQTILVEKQNELLAEQNELMRTQMNKTMKCKVTDYLNMAGAIGSFECGWV